MKTATALSLSAAVLVSILQFGAIGAILGQGPSHAASTAASISAQRSELARQTNGATSDAQFSVDGK
jgi:hypothetical protein